MKPTLAGDLKAQGRNLSCVQIVLTALKLYFLFFFSLPSLTDHCLFDVIIYVYIVLAVVIVVIVFRNQCMEEE